MSKRIVFEQNERSRKSSHATRIITFRDFLESCHSALFRPILTQTDKTLTIKSSIYATRMAFSAKKTVATTSNDHVLDGTVCIASAYGTPPDTSTNFRIVPTQTPHTWHQRTILAI